MSGFAGAHDPGAVVKTITTYALFVNTTVVPLIKEKDIDKHAAAFRLSDKLYSYSRFLVDLTFICLIDPLHYPVE